MNLMRAILKTAACGAALAAGAAALAQDRSSPPPLGLKGYDPVAYFTDGKPSKGTPSINFDFDESRYLFSTSKNRDTFASNPDRYSPQFGGLCATGLSMGMKTESDPNVWAIVDGKLYVFYSPQARDMAIKDPALIRRSHETWKKGK